MKRFLFLLTAFFIFLFPFYYFLAPAKGILEKTTDCPFCQKEILDKQKFYEDDLVIGLYTHRPVVKGHTLIIPKRHVIRFEDLEEKEMEALFSLIKKVDISIQKTYGTSSYLLLQKNGEEVGQTVPHVHIHYIPKKKGDFSFFRFIFQMLKAQVLPPLSKTEIQKETEKISLNFEVDVDLKSFP